LEKVALGKKVLVSRKEQKKTIPEKSRMVLNIFFPSSPL
jgi:hypothetical protein